MEKLKELKEPQQRRPEEVLADVFRRLEASPQPASSIILEPQPAVAGLAAGVDKVLAAELVRCADCRHVHYRSAQPPRDRTGEPWREWLECDHGLDVSFQGLIEPSRFCTKFKRRSTHREGGQ